MDLLKLFPIILRTFNKDMMGVGKQGLSSLQICTIHELAYCTSGDQVSAISTCDCGSLSNACKSIADVSLNLSEYIIYWNTKP